VAVDDPIWDVIVVGVGSVGPMAINALARRGAKVLGIEQYGIGHDRGGAGGESRLLRVNDIRSEEVPLARRSRKLLIELGERNSQSLFTATGVLHILPEGDTTTLPRMLSSSRNTDDWVETIPLPSLAARYPQHRVGSGLAVLDHVGGFVRPEATTMTAALEARDLGASVRTGKTVVDVQRDGVGYLVITDRDRHRTRKLLVTTGAWSSSLAAANLPPSRVRRIVMTWFGTEDPRLFDRSVFPAWTRTLSDGRHFFGAPTVDGASVKVALVASYGDFADPAHVPLEVHEHELDEVTDIALTHLSGVRDAVIRRSVYVDLFTDDDEFVIRPLDSTSDSLLITGLSGRGFKVAAALGEDAASYLACGSVPEGLKYWL
jgi:sarcosine oxidase